MTAIQPTNTNINEKIDELELLKLQSEETNLLEKLNLVIPIDVSTEEKSYWKAYFHVLTYGYRNELLTESEIPFYLDKFKSINLKNKLFFNNQLYDLFQDKVLKNAEVEEILGIDEIASKNEEMANKLAPEARDSFNYYMNTGEELTPEIRQEMAAVKDSIAQNQAIDRLEKVLGSKQTLNIGRQDIQKGRALTPDQVSAKFKLDRNIGPNEQAVEEASDKDPLNQISSQSQSLYALVKQNRDRLLRQETEKKRDIQLELDDAISTGTRAKPTGLDDLLKK